MTTILRREGYLLNDKRVQDMLRVAGLRWLRRAKKLSWVGDLNHPTGRGLESTYPDRGWAIDFQFDQTTDFRTLKSLKISGEFTKDACPLTSAVPTPTLTSLSTAWGPLDPGHRFVRMYVALSSSPMSFGPGAGSRAPALPISSRDPPRESAYRVVQR
jgi:hypothetical protein